MFKRFFGAGRAANRKITDRLYEQIVAAARQPALYADWGVPDTPLGRFEMVALHMFLVLHRLRGEAGAAREIAQDLTEVLAALGVGGRGAGRLRLGHMIERDLVAPHAEHRQAAVPCDRVQPRLELYSPAPLTKLAVRGDEHVLERVLGLLA
jgi:hypothetical protein